MDDDTTTAAEAGTGNRHLSRRTVLRAAGHAAWVVPAIQVVSMAPAFAASGTLQITAASGTWTRGGSSRVDGTVTVHNASTTDATGNLQLLLTFPNVFVWRTTRRGGSNRTLTISLVTGGWTAGTVSYSGTGTGRTATVVFTSSTQLVTGASKPMGFRATTNYRVDSAVPGGSSDTINVLPSATGFTGLVGVLNPS